MSSASSASRTDRPEAEPPATGTGTGTGTGQPAGPLPPGSPAAVAAGCRCSVLANAAFRCGSSAEPLLDPACPLDHG